MRTSLVGRSAALFSAMFLFTGSAQAAEKSFPVGPFSEVVLAGSPDVVVTIGGRHGVRAEGDAADLERLDIRVDGNRLLIDTKPGSWSWGSRKGVTVRITAPGLSAASITGSGDMQVGAVKGDFAARLTGSGDMAVAAVDAPKLTVSLTGSGDVLLSGGRCGTATLQATGSGDIDASRVRCETLNATSTGSGDIAAQASGTATVRTTGSGDIRVTGGARCNSRATGSGSVACS